MSACDIQYRQTDIDFGSPLHHNDVSTGNQAHDSSPAVPSPFVAAGALRVRDIVLGRGRIRVERSALNMNSKTIIGTTKTHAARSVAVS